MDYRDQGWHDNNEEARAQEEWELKHPPCDRCGGMRVLPDVDAVSCITCMQPHERHEWLERRVA